MLRPCLYDRLHYKAKNPKIEAGIDQAAFSCHHLWGMCSGPGRWRRRLRAVGHFTTPPSECGSRSMVYSAATTLVTSIPRGFSRTQPVQPVHLPLPPRARPSVSAATSTTCMGFRRQASYSTSHCKKDCRGQRGERGERGERELKECGSSRRHNRRHSHHHS
jgi:hypothetical protein